MLQGSIDLRHVSLTCVAGLYRFETCFFDVLQGSIDLRHVSLTCVAGLYRFETCVYDVCCRAL